MDEVKAPVLLFSVASQGNDQMSSASKFKVKMKCNFLVVTHILKHNYTSAVWLHKYTYIMAIFVKLITYSRKSIVFHNLFIYLR